MNYRTRAGFNKNGLWNNLAPALTDNIMFELFQIMFLFNDNHTFL
jgi:hypothetical protein